MQTSNYQLVLVFLAGGTSTWAAEDSGLVVEVPHYVNLDEILQTDGEGMAKRDAPTDSYGAPLAPPVGSSRDFTRGTSGGFSGGSALGLSDSYGAPVRSQSGNFEGSVVFEGRDSGGKRGFGEGAKFSRESSSALSGSYAKPDGNKGFDREIPGSRGGIGRGSSGGGGGFRRVTSVGTFPAISGSYGAPDASQGGSFGGGTYDEKGGFGGDSSGAPGGFQGGGFAGSSSGGRLGFGSRSDGFRVGVSDSYGAPGGSQGGGLVGRIGENGSGSGSFGESNSQNSGAISRGSSSPLTGSYGAPSVSQVSFGENGRFEGSSVGGNGGLGSSSDIFGVGVSVSYGAPGGEGLVGSSSGGFDGRDSGSGSFRKSSSLSTPRRGGNQRVSPKGISGGGFGGGSGSRSNTLRPSSGGRRGLGGSSRNTSSGSYGVPSGGRGSVGFSGGREAGNGSKGSGGRSGGSPGRRANIEGNGRGRTGGVSRGGEGGFDGDILQSSDWEKVRVGNGWAAFPTLVGNNV
eukprot:GFUD01099088.1.p1 GENE.GFUD01099088.1~~GFUD01099088.1.p1  ORF type:complete len:531 (+),score=137.68 GFUD01099088.1:53-1594(+)